MSDESFVTRERPKSELWIFADDYRVVFDLSGSPGMVALGRGRTDEEAWGAAASELRQRAMLRQAHGPL